MSYSQKYCLVHFIRSPQNGAEFHMANWPLHITLADVFAIDLEQSGVVIKLETLCNGLPSIVVTAESESALGETPVVLFSESHDLLQLHTEVVSLLEANSAIFNNPGFTKSGFIGHSTIQSKHRLSVGENITIDSLSLIDMFPNGDWRQRKVLATFQLAQ